MLLKVDSRQLELLEAFLQTPQRVLTRSELLDRVWQRKFIGESALSVCVAKLRKALGRTPRGGDYIENRYGKGYRFRARVLAVPAKNLVASTTDESTANAPVRSGVGRSDTRERLRAALDGAIMGKGSFVALMGEPGIGKTHLAESLEHESQARGVRTAWGRLPTDSGLPPLWPFVQLVRELDGDDYANDILRVWTDDKGAPNMEAPSSAERHRLSANRTSIRANNTIIDAIHKASREQPLVLLLDDLQWADAATLHTLIHLVSDITHWPILLVAMVRSPELGNACKAELGRILSHRNCNRIELARLGEAEVEDYVVRVFGVTDKALSREVYRRSEGSPFYMVELLRPWAGSSLPEPSQLRLSKVALDLLRQPLESLPRGARRVLSIAAVVGRDFDLGLVSQVDGREPDEILEEIDASLANGTIVESVQIPGAYAFDHELIRELLYTSLPVTECCKLHLRVGEVLERRRAAGVSVTSAQLAHHFLSALPYGNVDQAIVHARTAAAAARRLASHQDVRSLIARALEATKLQQNPAPELLVTLLLELAMVERVLGGVSYVEHLSRAIALAREHRLGPQLAISGRLLCPTPGLPAATESYQVLNDALAMLPPDAKSVRASVLVHLAWTAPNCESATRVNALLAEAEALIEGVDDPEPAELVWEAKLFFNSAPDRHAYAEMLATEIDRELRANPELALQGRIFATWVYRMVSACQRGDKQGMQRCINSRAALVTRLNNVELEWHQERVPLIMRMNCGDFSGLDRDFKRLRDRARVLKLQRWQDIWGRDYGALLMWTADVSEISTRARVALTPQTSEIPMIRARKILTLTEYGFLDDGRAALDQITPQWLCDLPHDREYIVVLAELASASAAVANLELCSELYRLLSPYCRYYAASVSYHNEGSISHMLGLLARALGHDEEARAHFETAHERNRNFDLNACAIRSRFELAKLLIDSTTSSERSQGTKLLEEVHTEATARGMQPIARAARMHCERANVAHQVSASDVLS